MKTRVRPTSQSMQSDSELIRDPARLVPLLERLSKQQAPLTVRFPGHGEHFTSYIVEVDKNNLLLDELLPNTGQPLLDKHRVIQASMSLRPTSRVSSKWADQIIMPSILLRYWI